MSTVVSLNSKMTNVSGFINSLFDSSVRSVDLVKDAVKKGKHHYSFADNNSATLILNAWLAAWQRGQGDSYSNDDYAGCPATDATLIQFLANYIKEQNKVQKMQFSQPDLEYKSTNKDGHAVYTNKGYTSKSFFDKDGNWNYGVLDSNNNLSKGSYGDDTVLTFLYRLLFGAHIVVVSHADDLKGHGIQNFKRTFMSDASLPNRRDPGNSHYKGPLSLNIFAYYYLDIEEDAVPSYNPLLCAFLAGSTTDGDDNTFIQLEGWQVASYGIDVGSNSWHMKDYDASTDTYWNFSTFGASAYAEKRCTPLFLTTTDFNLECDKDTKMPLYAGAGSKQGWMQTDLLDLA